MTCSRTATLALTVLLGLATVTPTLAAGQGKKGHKDNKAMMSDDHMPMGHRGDTDPNSIYYMASAHWTSPNPCDTFQADDTRAIATLDSIKTLIDANTARHKSAATP